MQISVLILRASPLPLIPLRRICSANTHTYLHAFLRQSPDLHLQEELHLCVCSHFAANNLQHTCAELQICNAANFPLVLVHKCAEFAFAQGC